MSVLEKEGRCTLGFWVTGFPMGYEIRGLKLESRLSSCISTTMIIDFNTNSLRTKSSNKKLGGRNYLTQVWEKLFNTNSYEYQLASIPIRVLCNFDIKWLQPW